MVTNEQYKNQSWLKENTQKTYQLIKSHWFVSPYTISLKNKNELKTIFRCIRYLHRITMKYLEFPEKG